MKKTLNSIIPVTVTSSYLLSKTRRVRNYMASVSWLRV